MTADVQRQSGVHGPPLDHLKDVDTVHGVCGQLPVAIDRPKERSLGVVLDSRGVQISIHVGLCLMVRGHFVKLPALLMQATPPGVPAVMEQYGTSGRMPSLSARVRACR